MQGKVSMVIPCYNKADYIGAMLESIVSQTWNNIEIIIVNDGSTDGTREIIAIYEEKLRKRGYEIIIIDQHNQGACAAVRKGLELVSGAYVCVIDADDELNPLYASIMAGWLEEYIEYDYCSCDYINVEYENGQKIKNPFKSHIWPKDTYTTEFFLCNDFSKAAWAFLTRKSYIEKCCLVDTFYTDTWGSYEPSFFIPFTTYGGRMKHFDMPLYYYSSDVDGLSQSTEYESKNNYWREYHRVVLLMLARIPESILDVYKKRYFEALSSFYTLKRSFLLSHWTKRGKKITDRLAQEFLAFVNNFLSLDPPIHHNAICDYPELVCRAVELALSGVWSELPVATSRIVAYGALGKAAKKRLPLLEKTKWQPTELWDKEGDGEIVRKPDFRSLNMNDSVLVLPTTQPIIDEVREDIERTGAKAYYYGDLNDILAYVRFPQLYAH